MFCKELSTVVGNVNIKGMLKITYANMSRCIQNIKRILSETEIVTIILEEYIIVHGTLGPMDLHSRCVSKSFIRYC